jgi:hypothetical protein
MIIFSDIKLARKLERVEAITTAEFVESRAKLFPESGVEWIEVAGVYAMFDGIKSPSTQTFGLGIFDEITETEMQMLESFFQKHNAPVFHEVSPMVNDSIITLLNERSYQPIELTNVMYRTLDSANFFNLQKNVHISTRIINKDEIDVFAETSVAGWSAEMPEFADFGIELCRVGANSKSILPFIAELGGKPIATGSMSIYDDVAMLCGASTIPESRNQGAQNALLAARLAHAYENGCKIAAMGARPGSQSQRNAEKNDFRVAYTRIKWQLKK